MLSFIVCLHLLLSLAFIYLFFFFIPPSPQLILFEILLIVSHVYLKPSVSVLSFSSFIWEYQPFRFLTFSRVQLFFFIQTFLIHKTAVSYWYSDFSHLCFQHSISVDTSFRPYSSLYGIQPLKSNIFFLFFLFSIKISDQLGFVLVSTCKQGRLEALLL